MLTRRPRFGVVVFPGTWSDRDCGWVIEAVLDCELVYLWHQDCDLKECDCVILPGGFSYGDYLRPGAIASLAPIIAPIIRFSQSGGLVWGICNGFQILCEAGLLPGALRRNQCGQFRCATTYLLVEDAETPYTSRLSRGSVVEIPISHGEGRYHADDATLADLERRGQVVFRYATAAGDPCPQANPNGSVNNIAGIVNRAGNVLGMMPHPERCAEEALGCSDGLWLFESVLNSIMGAGRAITGGQQARGWA